MRSRPLIIAILTTLGACGGVTGSGHVDLSGKSPAEGSGLAAHAICKRKVACGTVSITCTAGPSLATQCSAVIVHAEESACYADAQPNIERLLSCQALTPEQVNMIEACVDAMATQVCVTQAEADALARTEEMGMPLPPDPQPPECDFLTKPLPGC
jgi:hypothetical protein